MTEMCGRTIVRAAALAGGVLVAVLAGADPAGAQQRRLRAAAGLLATGQAAGKPGQAANENVDPAELARLFDAYTVMQAQQALGLDEARFGPFVTRLRALQELRRRHLRERGAVLRDLRRLLQTPGNDAQLKERLDALVRLETATRADQTKAMDAIDELLDVRQRARLRLLEQQLELRKLELVNRARQRQRANRP
jgi:DNA primase